jgi:hypothetical protein
VITVRGMQVRAVGRVADAQPEVADKCLHGFMALIACAKSEKVLGETIVVVRQVGNRSPLRHRLRVRPVHRFTPVPAASPAVPAGADRRECGQAADQPARQGPGGGSAPHGEGVADLDRWRGEHRTILPSVSCPGP